MIRAMPSREASELDRIREAYRERDAAPAASGYSWEEPGYRLYMQRLESTLLGALGDAGQPVTGRRVLEVGCGGGYFLARMLDYGARSASGIDLMESRAQAARERYPQLEVIAGDASEMPYEDQSFDLVTQFTCLSSVLDPDLRARIAAEMWRVLAPGGAIVSYDIRPTPGPIRALARAKGMGGGASSAGRTPTTAISVAELRRLFPDGAPAVRSASLHLDLGLLLARRRRALARLAAAIPALRTHLLAVIAKPGGARTAQSAASSG